MQYRAEIDGLRALAILPVMLFHANISGFGGGYLGVDIFFVISGYLITNIILHENDQGSFSLANFYARRARRILPALFFVLFTCVPMAAVWLNPVDRIDFLQSLAGAASFSSNVVFWLQSGYFEPEAELRPLLHTWSLGVEVQYYLLFPLLMLWLWKYTTVSVKAAVAGLFAVSLMLAHWWAHQYPQAAFYLLPTRLWEILLGSLCAYYLRSERSALSPFIQQSLSLLGLILIAFSVVWFNAATPTPSLYTLIPTAGAALLILFAREKTLAHALLGGFAFRHIGLLSYSLYLWHFPLLAFLKYITLNTYGETEVLIVLAVACVLAVISYRFVEQTVSPSGNTD